MKESNLSDVLRVSDGVRMIQGPAPSADAGLEPESEGFGQIFEAQHRQLFRLALLLTGGDRCLSEDVVGQVFLATLPKWRKGTVAEPGSYLRRAVVNQVNGPFAVAVPSGAAPSGWP